MIEVIIGLLPATAVALYLFQKWAAAILASCVIAAILTEWVFNAVRKRPQTLGDCSAALTGLILGLSLPPTLPVWMAILGSVVSVAIGKMVFGGLGGNIFNPAMVGRAFLMAAFGTFMTTWVMPVKDQPRDAMQAVPVTQATPLALAKQVVKDAHNTDKPAKDKVQILAVNGHIADMFMGNISGSVGETSALAWLVGGLFLLVRRTITWHIPLAVLLSALVTAEIAYLINGNLYPNPLVHMTGGALMFGAFFIATDPVSSPLTRSGRIIFGVGVGVITMLIRLIGGYPEGFMYAILLMNSVTPLLDRWTRPTPQGGHVNVS